MKAAYSRFKQQLLFCAIFLLVIPIFGFIPLRFSFNDLFGYWCSSRLLWLGLNPFDPILCQELWPTQLNGPPPLRFTQRYAPPFALSSHVPIGIIPDYRIVYPVWTSLTSALLLFFGSIFFKIRSTVEIRNKKKLLILLTFPPLLLVVVTGQIVLLPFLGVVGWFYCLQNKPFYSGTFAALTLCKPQIFLPLFLFQALYFPFRRFFSGFLMVALVLVLLPEAFRPGIYLEYISSNTISATSWSNPTVGALLQWWLAPANPVVRFIPLLGALIFICICRVLKFSLDPVLHIIPLCLVSSPYLWSYDFMFLIPTIGACLQRKFRGYDLCWVFLILNVLLALSTVPNYMAVWYPIVVLLIGCLLNRSGSTKPQA